MSSLHKPIFTSPDPIDNLYPTRGLLIVNIFRTYSHGIGTTIRRSNQDHSQSSESYIDTASP